MNYKSIIIAIVVLSTLAFVSAYISQTNKNVSDIYRHIEVSDCEIANSSCEIELDKGSSVKINILPRGLPETEVLHISVDTKDAGIEALSVIFYGIEIDTFTPDYHLYKESDTRFTGKGSLVVCSLSKMHWVANFMIKKEGKNWKVSLPFEKDVSKSKLLPDYTPI